jgi:hypothetical protein
MTQCVVQTKNVGTRQLRFVKLVEAVRKMCAVVRRAILNTVNWQARPSSSLTLKNTSSFLYSAYRDVRALCTLKGGCPSLYSHVITQEPLNGNSLNLGREGITKHGRTVTILVKIGQKYRTRPAT